MTYNHLKLVSLKNLSYNELTVIFVFFAATEFFRLSLLSLDIIYLAQFGVQIYIILALLINIIYIKKGSFVKPKNSNLILVLLIAVLLSMFNAYITNEQAVFITFWAQRSLYFYFFYYYLHFIGIKPKQLEKLLFYFGILFLCLFFFQYILYPTKIFAVRISPERGTIRIFLPGSNFLTFAYLFTLNIFFRTNKTKYFIISALLLSYYVLMGGRFGIFLIMFITILYVLFAKRIKSRPLIILLVGIAGGILFIIFQDIFMGLISLLMEDSSNMEENVRTKATRFFLTEFMPNILSYIFGNGESHQASAYGMRVWFYKAHYGFYQSDIGVIGEYTKYGLIFILTGFILLKKLVFTNYSSERSYIRYLGIMRVIALPFGAGFTNSYAIVMLCCLLYIIDYEDVNR